MSEWKDYYSVLRCLHCRGNLGVINTPTDFNQYAAINGELICLSCKKKYPIFQDIPVMFKDDGRTRILIDSTVREIHLRRAAKEMQQAVQMTGNELDEIRKGNELAEALGWELLFWERWKHSDEGFVEFSRDSIEAFLKEDSQGGGRLRFFNRVLFFEGTSGNSPISIHEKEIGASRLLNIGAGRDFLLERFLEKGYEVIEQDIVLESLLFLKKRKASFCLCCDARDLPFEDNTFNMAISFGVLHHVWPIETPIAELLRVTCGNIYLNEPSSFALIRLGVFLPNIIRHKIKRLYEGDSSPSPYEKSINPYAFKNIVKSLSAEIVDLSFTRSSWISPESRGLMGVLRMINLVLASLLPFTSSHFDAMVRK